jgi:hypothetical protein
MSRAGLFFAKHPRRPILSRFRRRQAPPPRTQDSGLSTSSVRNSFWNDFLGLFHIVRCARSRRSAHEIRGAFHNA